MKILNVHNPCRCRLWGMVGIGQVRGDLCELTTPLRFDV